MMRFAVASDLHFEFHRDGGSTLTGELPDTEIIVIAGDLASSDVLWDALLHLLRKYQHVVFVYGNHEFYGSNFQKVRQNMEKLQRRLPKLREVDPHGQLHILDNSTCEIEGQRFVGTTMWFRKLPGIELKHHYMNDFRVIGGGSERIYQENVKALEFLEATVGPDDVVVTHHLPSEGSIAKQFVGNPYNCFYMCDVEDLILNRQPKLWVHGHTHDSCSYTIDRTHVLCNPFGYVGHGINPKFKPDLVVEV